MKGAAEVAGYFAENLRRLRKQANLSQEEVGLRSSLHRTEVGLLERGTRVPRIDTVLKLAAALDVPPKRLLAGISWTPGEIGEAKPGRFEHNLNPDPPQQDQPEDRKGKEPRGQTTKTRPGLEGAVGSPKCSPPAPTSTTRHIGHPPVRCLGRTF